MKLNDAVHHIETLAARYESMVGLSEFLREAAPLATYIPTLETKKNELIADINRLTSEHEELKVKNKAELDRLESQIVDTTDQGVRLEAATQEKIQQMFEKAEADAKELFDKNYNAKSQELATLDEQVALRHADVKKLDQDIAGLKVDKEKAEKETADANVVLESVRKTIDQLTKLNF